MDTKRPHASPAAIAMHEAQRLLDIAHHAANLEALNEPGTGFFAECTKAERLIFRDLNSHGLAQCLAGMSTGAAHQ